MTIFQDDLRISTNVTDEFGRRAIGTRASQKVVETVLKRGEPWIGRAFVVNHWYIAACEPIKDLSGQVIGMLYGGMLEKPYIDLRNSVVLTFTGRPGLTSVILLLILSAITSTINKPLQSMVQAIQRIAQGELNHRVKVDWKDEIGKLAESFSRLPENLKVANDNLVK